MKKRCILCFLFAGLILLQSCSTYIARYPKYLTERYWRDNYVAADPNLAYFVCAKNSLSEHKYSGQKWRFFALKNVPMDKYLCTIHRFTIFDPYYDHVILKHKDLTEEPIFDYTATACTLYWGTVCINDLSEMKKYGNKSIVETISSLDAEVMQNHIIDCIKNDTFVPEDKLSMTFAPMQNNRGEPINAFISIRLQFAEYDNLIWDATVYQDVNDDYEAKYYMLVYVFNEEFDFSYEFGYYTGGENYYMKYIPVPAELEPLIDEAINNKE